jgi:hypothetical protein
VELRLAHARLNASAGLVELERPDIGHRWVENEVDRVHREAVAGQFVLHDRHGSGQHLEEIRTTDHLLGVLENPFRLSSAEPRDPLFERVEDPSGDAPASLADPCARPDHFSDRLRVQVHR